MIFILLLNKRIRIDIVFLTFFDIRYLISIVFTLRLYVYGCINILLFYLGLTVYCCIMSNISLLVLLESRTCVVSVPLTSCCINFRRHQSQCVYSSESGNCVLPHYLLETERFRSWCVKWLLSQDTWDYFAGNPHVDDYVCLGNNTLNEVGIIYKKQKSLHNIRTH